MFILKQWYHKLAGREWYEEQLERQIAEFDEAIENFEDTIERSKTQMDILRNLDNQQKIQLEVAKQKLSESNS